MKADRLWFETEAEKRGLQQGLELGQRQALYSLVTKRKLTAEDAAEELGITMGQLQAADGPGVLS